MYRVNLIGDTLMVLGIGIVGIEGAMKTKYRFLDSKDLVFYSARSTLSAAIDALFAEK